MRPLPVANLPVPVTRASAVRSRVAGRPEPPYDRLFDPLVDELARGGPLARERFATLWTDTAALRELAEAKRAPLPASLARELTEYHVRLGASERSLDALSRLARGEAVCAVSGQQPAPLGGPLYSLHKIAATIGLGARVAARTRVPCVALFWMHAEDSDFAEIRHATVADAALTLHDLALPDAAHAEGGLVGGVPLAPLAALERQALGHWDGLPGVGDVATLLARAHERGRDLGEAFSALALALFAEQGLVVVDPRLPAFREAARPIIGRYLNRAAEVSAAARQAGDVMEQRLGRRPLNDAALESFVFLIEDGRRHKLSVAEALSGGAERTLSPSVSLRPAVQDGVFPTVAMAVGPGEAAYLAQLREVFEGLGVRPACAVPRFGATWLPRAAHQLLEASGADPWELVTGADAVLRHFAESQVPAAVRGALERAHRGAMEGLVGYAEISRQVDASLPQMVESARAKVDYQFARLLEGLTGKVRHRLERQHPEWVRLRYYLQPGDKLQERRLASLEPVAHRGLAVVGEVCDLAEAHAQALEHGRLEHVLADL